MTVIAAARQNNLMIMAGDRAWSNQDSGLITLSKTPKITQPFTKMLVGVAGDGDIGQAVLESEWPDMHKNPIKTIRSHMRHVAKPYEDHDLSVLICYEDKIWSYENGVVLEHDYFAIGSGSLVALGTMWTKPDPVEACSAAIYYISSCSGQIDRFQYEI